MIPFIDLIAQRKAYLQELELAEKTVLDSGCYIGGREVMALETEISAFCGAKNVIACGSGTDALTIALMALGIRPGDEVIVPDFTFIAPAESVALLGGIPKFADIDPETLQVSPESVEALISPATKGIIGVDLFGQCAPFGRLREIARRHGLWTLEDAAQAFGATTLRDLQDLTVSKAATPNPTVKACTLADMSITSFYPSKPFSCYGDGGAVFTADAELARRARQIANHGSSARYLHETVGMNSRLDALQASILRVKLRHLTEELERRRANARLYDQFFSTVPGVVPQKLASGNSSTYAQYTLLVEDRESFIKKLEQAEIPYCIHYPRALHRQPCFAECGRTVYACGSSSVLNCEAAPAAKNNADIACEKVISLPFCAFTDVKKIIEKLSAVL